MSKTNLKVAKEEFIKTGMWPNQVMYDLWMKAWNICSAHNSQELMEEINRLARLCEAKDAEIAAQAARIELLERDMLSGTYEARYAEAVEQLCEAQALQNEKIKWCKQHDEQFSEAQAQIAMQHSALKVAKQIVATMVYQSGVDSDIPVTCAPLDEAISATSETVAAWRAKETEPAHREVAGLHNLKYELMGIAVDVDAGNGFDVVCRSTLQRVIDALNDTQATALAYEREVENRGAVKALEEMLSSGDVTNTGYIHKSVIQRHIKERGKEPSPRMFQKSRRCS